MGKIEVDIYMNQFVGFFEKNPDQLKKLIGNIDPSVFYKGIRTIVENNSTSESPIEPTRKQIIDLIVNLNSETVIEKSVFPVMEHHMGNIIMN
jgi:hypothetical protein